MSEELNLESAVDGIASDLGLGVEDQADPTQDDPDPADPAPASEIAADPAAAAAPVVRAAPKAWAKEHHENWSKLDPKVQEYIELREKQALDGLMQYKTPADEWNAAVKEYLPLIQAQGAKPHEAVRYLFEAHKSLSSGTPEQKLAYLQKVAQSYGIDFAKAASAPAGVAETPEQKQLRERIERIERRDHETATAAEKERNTRVATAVQSFADAKDEAGNAKHPYFDECAEDIVALINAGHPLDKAYEKAVYANPVTRAKELERLRKADAEALRAKAREEGEKARNTSRTNVNSRDTRRAPTASKANSWEDTLSETLKEIKERAH